jgi:1,4-dihydroxy-2-naphthoate octaprenyltransferase
MWAKALQVIPRLGKEEFQRLDVVSKWLISTRSAVLVTTFTSATMAGLLALRAGTFDLLRWLVLLISLWFAHGTNNLLNDLTDYSRGVDTNNYFRSQYGPQPMEQGLWSRRTHLTYAAISGLLALAGGIYLVLASGWLAFWLMLAGAVFVLFYTYPFKHIGLGEISVLLVWGPLMVGGGYYVLSGQWDWFAAIAGLAYSFAVGLVIFGKHIDKLDEDKAKRIYTLPVILGEKVSRYVVIAMMAAQYLIVIGLVIAGYFSPVMLIVLASLYWAPPVVKLLLKPRPKEKPEGTPLAAVWPLWFVASTFYITRKYGMLLLLGLILQLFIG